MKTISLNSAMRLLFAVAIVAFGVQAGYAQQVSDLGKSLTPEDLTPKGPPGEDLERLFHGGVKAGGLNMKYGGFISTVYDDNVNLNTDGNKDEDIEISFGPKFKLTYGGDQIESDLLRNVPDASFWTLEYKPTFVVYVDDAAEDRLDHYVNGVYNFSTDKTQMSYRMDFARHEDSDVRIGDRIQRFDLKNDVTVNHSLGAFTTIGGTLGHRLEFFDDDAFVDSQEVAASFYVDHQVTEKTTWGGSIGGGWLDADTNDQYYGNVSLRFGYHPSPKLAFSSSWGADIRDNDDDSMPVNFAFNLRGTWTPNDSTSLALIGYQHVTNSTLNFDSNYLATGAELHFVQGIWDDRLTWRLNPGYEHADYYGVSSGVIDNRVDDYVTVETGFTFIATDWVTLDLFYEYRTNMSNNNPVDFENQRAGLTVSVAY